MAIENVSLERIRIATDELTVRILATVRNERLNIIIEMNIRVDRIATQLKNRVII
jgi:hypothetical protein